MDEHEDDDDEGFEVKPFVCRLSSTTVLSGQINSHGHAEWEWSRVNAAVQLETQREGLFLKRGLEEFKTEFLQAQLSINEMHYRGAKAGAGEKGRHTVESRALVLMLCILATRRQTRVQSKEMSVKLLRNLLQECMGSGNADKARFVTSIPTMDGSLQLLNVQFQDGTTRDLAEWITNHNHANKTWQQLRAQGWLSLKMTSTWQDASVFDILLWLLYVKATAPKSPAWKEVGAHLWPKMLFMLGQAVEQYALGLSSKDPEAAPLLKTRAGNNKRVSWVNKIVLLKKVEKNKQHRRVIMQSHKDVVPASTALIVKEAQLECQEYMGLLSAAFEGCTHFQISWDPSTYSGDEVMVLTIWSNQCNTAAYLPLQYLHPVQSNEVDPEIRALAQRKQITRIAGYGELRAVSHALKGIHKDLSMFEIRQDVLWRPLKANEKRHYSDGHFWVYNTTTGDCERQLPDGWTVRGQHVLVSYSDQGGINMGALDYVQHMTPVAILVANDGTHRAWNDLKLSLKASQLFRTFLSFAIVQNVNYGPAGTKSWFIRKQNALKKFCANRSCNKNPFLSYVQHVCHERGEVEDGTPEQREHLFQQLSQMKGCQIHGPLTKLMRWFSWWEGAKFHVGEYWYTKLIMLHEGSVEDGGEEDFESTLFDPQTEGMTPQQELRHLKMKYGTWALAPALITTESMWQRCLIYEGGRPMWSKYSHLAKKVKTCEEVQDQLVAMVANGWKQELVDICNQFFFSVQALKRVYFDPEMASPAHLLQHHKFAVNLLAERALSLVAMCCRPPWRYAGLCKPELFKQTQARMQKEFEVVMTAERLAAQGHHIKPLDLAHGLRTPFVRLHFLANELDQKHGAQHDVADGVLLAQTACRNIGDTVVIENCHQHIKDLLAVARHEQIGRMQKFQSLIRCGVLEGRGLKTVSVSDKRKATATLGKGIHHKLVSYTHPNQHHMNKKFQGLMKYKSSSPGFDWPSSSHTSLLLVLCFRSSRFCLLSFVLPST